MNFCLSIVRIRPACVAGLLYGLVRLLDLASLAATGAVTPLGEMEPTTAEQGWGSLMVNRSVWDRPLRIRDRGFQTGLGTHANSEITYDLSGAFERFDAWVGVDAAMAGHPEASVVFKVLGDGRPLFESGVMHPDSEAQRVSVDLRGVRELQLLVSDAGDGINADHADWADAVLIGEPAAVPSPTLIEAKPVRHRIRATGIEVGISEDGTVVEATIGKVGAKRVIQCSTALAHCTNAGAVRGRELTEGGVEFVRNVVHDASAQRATITERFRPSKDSIRWETEIRGTGDPWTTGIETRLCWPANDTTRFWMPWEDPVQRRDVWRDPLVLQPLVNKRLWYGAARWDEARPGSGYRPTSGNGFVVPLLTFAEPDRDLAMSVVLSPEDSLFELTLAVRTNGSCIFSRNDHRISSTNTVHFAMDLVGHEADWRGGMGWMVRRYADFFEPPNPRAHDIAGLGAYSDWEGELDARRLKRMGFRVNWKASYDFPYMGMFLPPIEDTERYPRLVKRNTTSIAQLRDYSARMRRMGFHVLNYFNVTEFGAGTGQPAAADPTLAPTDRWKNVHNFLNDEVGDGVLLDLHGRRYGSWEGCVAMDCGGPRYRGFLLDQARRHIEKLPDSDGICIDRLDWLRYYNLRADDGESWRRGQPVRSLYASWRSLLAELGPMFHRADKVVFVNAMVNRTELMRHVDGIYHEFGHVPCELNGAALQCVLKPCIAWTPDENALKPDPDAYFQRHLHLGVYPTAPLPANDHTIASSPWADQWYLDYGPLMDLLRGRRWVLAPHCVEVVEGDANVNLFQVPDGYVVPVTSGGAKQMVTIRLRAVPGLDRSRCEVLHPGDNSSVAVEAKRHDAGVEMRVPLKRGCAMVRLIQK